VGRPRPARLGASRGLSPAKAQRPPVGGGTDRQHGWQRTEPLCWRYAGREILAILAQFRELRLGSGPRNRVHGTSSGKLKTSGSSEAWYRARFGTERSRVRIPPSRPVLYGPYIRLNQTRPEERRIQEVRGAARSVRVRVDGGVPGRCGFVAQRPTGRLNAWRTREASSLAKASLTGAWPMIPRK
jgi:hypothetical protein